IVRGIANSGAPAAFAQTFPRELLEYLVYVAIAQQPPPLVGVLHFMGELGERRVPADSDSGRAEHTELLVNWERLGQLAEDPGKTIKQSYGWGKSFDGLGFLRSLGILVRGFGGRASLYPASR